MAAELKNKFVYQIILSFSQVLLPLVTYPYITRILGPENIGRINYADFVSQVFTILAAFGIPFYAVREIAMTRHDGIKRAALVKELALLHILFSIIASAGFVAFTFSHWQQSPVLYALAMANILLSAFSFDWYIQGMEHFKFAALRTLLVRAVMLLAFFILVKKTDDYALYFGIFTAAIFIIALFNLYKLFAENNFANQPINLKQHFKPLWHFFLTSSAISIYVYFDTIILQHITHSEQAVGYYTIVLKIVKIFLAGIIAIGTVLMARLSYLVGTGDISEVKRHLNKVLEFIIVAGVPVCLGLLLMAPEIIETIAGDKFLPAVPLMRILAFLPLVIGLSNLFCFQTLVPFKQEKKFLLAVVVGGLVSISLNFILIPHLNAAGAAIAAMATESVITILSGLLAYNVIQFSTKPTVIVQTIFASLFFIPVIVVCRISFSSPLLILLLVVPSSTLIYFVVQYYIFNNSIIREIKDYAQNLLNFK